MIATVSIVGAIVTMLTAYRWLRVAQREHYLAGSCNKTLWRWVSTRWPNSLLVLGLAAVPLIAFVHGDLRLLASSLMAALVIVATPWRMALRGHPPLVFTRRLRTLASVFTLLAAGAIAIGWRVLSPQAATLTVAAFTPFLLDLSLAITAPLERMTLDRYRRAAARRRDSIDPFVIAITGSWGKTSTKNHLRDLLSDLVDVVASPASWNNTAGLSKTINEHLTPGTEVLIAEMGMYGSGEIRSLSSWVRPDIAVITSIGAMHLERVGSIEGIVRAKSEILENVDTAVLWVEDDRIRRLADTCAAATVWRVGSLGDPDVDVAVETDHANDTFKIWLGPEMVGCCPMGGGIHASNIGCAVGAALAYGADREQVGLRLQSLTGSDHRTAVGVNNAGIIVIDDTFNSNPEGAAEAVMLLNRSVSGHRVVVTPGMVELGHLQNEENAKLARHIRASGATLVVVGWTNRKALLLGSGNEAVVVADRDAGLLWVQRHLRKDDGVLWENDLPDHYP